MTKRFTRRAAMRAGLAAVAAPAVLRHGRAAMPSRSACRSR